MHIKVRGAYYKISTLTEEERQTVEAFAKQIDLTNFIADPSVRSGNAEEDGGFLRIGVG